MIISICLGKLLFIEVIYMGFFSLLQFVNDFKMEKWVKRNFD